MTTIETDRPDLTLILPRSTYRHVVHTLRSLLPPPASDTPEALVHRDNAAIAEVASLLPANADEAGLAATCVAARAYALDCLRLAGVHRADINIFLKCSAQSAAMQRQADRSRGLLQRLQADRQKREADSAATDRAAWTEHCAIGMMADALPDRPAVATPEPPPPPPMAEPSDAEPLPADATAEAELYVAMYPQRAALIRRLGGLPDNPSFGPPDASIVHSLVTGRTPALLALDAPPSHATEQRLADR